MKLTQTQVCYVCGTPVYPDQWSLSRTSHLIDNYRYQYVVTDLPGSAEDVLDETYLRCDQENVIEQLGTGIAGWRMPVAEFVGNAA